MEPVSTTSSSLTAAVPYAQMELAELVVLAQQDDMRAMEMLVKKCQKNVFLSLRQLLPERPDDIADLTQDVLLRMCRSIKSLRNINTFKYWLNRIITNRYYDEIRKKGRSLNLVSMDAGLGEDEEPRQTTRQIADDGPSPDEVTLGGELDDEIRKAILNLPEQFRIMIVLREQQGLSYEEIASLTDTSIGTVKSRLARARGKLQEALKPYLATQ
ncbi:MAG: sigma-70 family RNA polymerase sigma factor [Cyanobacteria bacterium HKST-UBA04]|nr:sigma-70 family RNA polymerase sigma factor [Cyanobacteria bacterium HKST-UBA04]MCA9841364.1 sigma-70 family RNA polymerase sigma factor [Cyanobacteria bacterium HKST-UBA03]